MSQILCAPLSGWLNISASGASFAGARDLSALVSVEFLAAGGQQVFFNFEHNHDTIYASVSHSHIISDLSGVAAASHSHPLLSPFFYTGVNPVATNVTSLSLCTVPPGVSGFKIDAVNGNSFAAGYNGVLYGKHIASGAWVYDAGGSYNFSAGILTLTGKARYYNFANWDYLLAWF